MRPPGTPFRPSAAELAAASGATVPDVVAPGLDVVFCGINPGLYTAAIGHHFGRPGNRFWKVLARSGLTDRELSPFEDASLLDYLLGVTNLVGRATATADELGREELVAGGEALAGRLEAAAPRFVAVLGMGAYRRAFRRPRAGLGPQADTIGPSQVWLLPNPSGLQARYQLPELIQLFGELRDAAGRSDLSAASPPLG